MVNQQKSKICRSCMKIFPESEAVWTRQEEAFCPECASERLVLCERCGFLVRWDDYDSNACECYACKGEGRIHRYHGAEASLPRFFADGEKQSHRIRDFEGIGLEIEIDRFNEDEDEEAACVYDLHDLLGARAVFEHDGSLDNGFEIVTRPHTVEAFWNDFPLRETLAVCLKHGYSAHDIKTCGLHLHISRRFFGRGEAQERAIAKMVAFYERFYPEIVRISRRAPYEANRWAGRSGCESAKMARKKAKGECDFDRYRAVNTTNASTVEIRIMRGTLNEATFRATVDFMLTVARNARRVKWDDVFFNPAKMLDGIKRETASYIKARGAFLDIIEEVNR